MHTERLRLKGTKCFIVLQRSVGDAGNLQLISRASSRDAGPLLFTPVMASDTKGGGGSGGGEVKFIFHNEGKIPIYVCKYDICK